MIYYGLVDNIKDKHKSGIYARKALSEDQLLNSFKDFEKKDSNNYWLYSMLGLSLFGGMNPFIALAVTKAYDYFFNTNDQFELKLIKAIDNSKEKSLIFFDEGMDNNYSISKNQDLFYGLLDEFGNANNALKRILKSKGGSKLIILERDKVPSERHYGGKQGKFSAGLYCEHPKDNNILIPLNNYQELIKSMILEETLNVYEALGAKSILIEDVTEQNMNLGAKGPDPIHGVNMGAEAGANKSIEILRNKKFGKGSFNPSRADSYMKFVPDFPHIMTVVESRKNGNLLSEEFTETVNLSADLDVNVLELYKLNIGFKSKRKWHFKVEFYDKNELR